MPLTRPLLSAAALFALALGSTTAHAEPPTKLECVAAHEQSQVARRAGKLLEAKKKLLICAQSSCPEAAQEPCQRWLREVEASIPTVVIAARGRDGNPARDVRVLVDGNLLAERLEGHALAVDAGTHRFRFEYDNAKPREVELTILEGEKNRRISISFAETRTADSPRTKTAPAKAEAHPIPVGTYVFGAVGVAALATFGIFAWRGLDQEQSLRDDGCAPNCSKDDVNAVRRDYLIGDIALGVGVVSLGVATWLFIDSRSSPRPIEAGLSVTPNRTTAAIRGSF